MNCSRECRQANQKPQETHRLHQSYRPSACWHQSTQYCHGFTIARPTTPCGRPVWWVALDVSCRLAPTQLEAGSGRSWKIGWSQNAEPLVRRKNEETERKSNIKKIKSYLTKCKIKAVPFNKGLSFFAMSQETYMLKINNILSGKQFAKVKRTVKRAQLKQLKEKQKVNWRKNLTKKDTPRAVQETTQQRRSTASTQKGCKSGQEGDPT